MKSSRVHALLTLAAVWLGVVLVHYPWRCLPYYWDEAGYYAPAAADFYRRGLLIPESTEKLGHTPLLTAFVGTTWRILGLSPCWAREAMMLVAAATLVATYVLGCRVAGRRVGAWSASLLAVSPLFFAQSSMLHIETGPALFVTLAVLALLPHPELPPGDSSPSRDLTSFALAASLAILSKETAIILLPVAWTYAWRVRRERRPAAWFALAFPLLPILAWTLYYHHATGYWTGNVEYLQYNLYSTFNPVRFLLTLLRRLYQLLIGGFDWILVAGALLGAAWQRKIKGAREAGAAMAGGGRAHGQGEEQLPAPQGAAQSMNKLPAPEGPSETARLLDISRKPETHPHKMLGWPQAWIDSVEAHPKIFADFLLLASGLCAVYIVFHSLVGGAVLRRYLLPVFPVFYLGAVAFVWRLPKKLAQGICVLALAYFIAAWFINPPYPFAFEDNLAYADFVRLHQRAAHFLEGYPGAPRVLTAWPATGELSVPFLGYLDKPLRVVPIDGFAAADFRQVRADSFDLLYLYSRRWEPASNWLVRFRFLRVLQQRYFDYTLQLSDEVLTARYGLKLVAQYERRGQWVRIYSK